MELLKHEQMHLNRLRPLLPECTVLLKRNHDFPLPGPCPIALYGSGVRRTVKGGTGSGEVNSRYFDTVEDGFRKAGFSITTSEWLDGYDRIKANALNAFNADLRARAKAERKNVMLMALGAVVPEPEYELPIASDGDTAIYVLSRNSGEGTDRKGENGDILLSDTEVRDILACHRQYRRFLLALNVGGVVDLSPVMDVENILVLSQLGVETGDALADIVLGKANPSGKLTTTWAAWKDRPDILDFGGNDDTDYHEGVYVGYRYYDAMKVKPLFAFGHGLSFTAFTWDEPRLSVKGSAVSVYAAVHNTGSRPGKEVLQVYVSIPAGKLHQPPKLLAGWHKTELLKPGQARNCEVRFDLRELASYDTQTASYVLEAGDYIVRIGTASDQTRAVAILRLSETVVMRKVKSLADRLGFADFVPTRTNEAMPELPVIDIDTQSIQTETVNYTFTPDIAPETEALTDEQLAKLFNGAFGKPGLMSMIGNASLAVCGAAGETARVDGFQPIVMADGPAGLRLDQRYFTDKKGAHSMEVPIPQSLLPFMSKPLRLFMNLFFVPKPRRKDELHYQYCTALPIGTAVAQSWNPEVAETCGDIVGAEMDIYGIDLWLAPALNLHRSIQCGRNFEYYSEDPLISGRMAAAITRGVQRHPGKGVTIKHFAANNQEHNRTVSSSNVSERALRELYLKGFEICIREAAPMAVMTSYNLLGGQHTSTRRDLCTDILRREFGFEGLLMTDWIVHGMAPKDAKYAEPEAWQVALAGGDVFMPGSQKDMENVLAALKDGRLSRKQLEQHATRLLNFRRHKD